MTPPIPTLPFRSHEAFRTATAFLASALKDGQAMTFKEIWEAGSSRGWTTRQVATVRKVKKQHVTEGGSEVADEGELEWPVQISKTDLKRHIIPSLKAQGLLERHYVRDSHRLDPVSRGKFISAPKTKASSTSSSTSSSSDASTSTQRTINEWAFALPRFLRATPSGSADPLLQAAFPQLIDPSSKMTISRIATALKEREVDRALAKQFSLDQKERGLHKTRDVEKGHLNRRRARARVGKEKRAEDFAREMQRLEL